MNYIKKENICFICIDLVKRYLIPEANDKQQKLFGRAFVIVIVALALLVAATATDALVLLGGLAVAYGFQMWPALLGICYIRFFTGTGVAWGLAAGLTAVTFTYITAVSYTHLTLPTNREV